MAGRSSTNETGPSWTSTSQPARACPTLAGVPHEPRVSLSPELPHRLRRLAEAAAPREFVALLAGPTWTTALLVDHVQPLANVAAALDRFEVEATGFAAAEGALRNQGRRWLGFVHSHPVGRAALSASDRQQLWPHCLQLVVGLAASAAREAWLRAFHGDGVTWRELPIEIASPWAAAAVQEPA